MIFSSTSWLPAGCSCRFVMGCQISTLQVFALSACLLVFQSEEAAGSAGRFGSLVFKSHISFTIQGSLGVMVGVDTATYRNMPWSRLWCLSRSTLDEARIPPAGSSADVICRRGFSAGTASGTSRGMVNAAAGAVSHFGGLGFELLCDLTTQWLCEGDMRKL
jgi:hypothetical protein